MVKGWKSKYNNNVFVNNKTKIFVRTFQKGYVKNEIVAEVIIQKVGKQTGMIYSKHKKIINAVTKMKKYMKAHPRG